MFMRLVSSLLLVVFTSSGCAEISVTRSKSVSLPDGSKVFMVEGRSGGIIRQEVVTRNVYRASPANTVTLEGAPHTSSAPSLASTTTDKVFSFGLLALGIAWFGKFFKPNLTSTTSITSVTTSGSAPTP